MNTELYLDLTGSLSESAIILICYAISQDHMIKGSHDLKDKDGSPSR